VAELRPDPLGELTALPRTLAELRACREKRDCERKGKDDGKKVGKGGIKEA